MGRSYSDNSYATKQTIAVPDTGALNGTNASANTIVSRMTFMQPSTVTDFNVFMVAGGTMAGAAIVGRSLAGTGATVALGTFVGTGAISTVHDGAVVGGTTCNFSKGDDIVIERAGGALGTTTTVENLRFYIQYRENFVVSDS
jgi:hypothetical protein